MKPNSFYRILFPAFLLISLLSGCKKEQEKIVTPPEETATDKARDQNGRPHTKKYSADVATAWFNFLAITSKNKPYTPPQSIRIYAYAGMALYESVVPGMPEYRSMYKYFTGNKILSEHKREYYWPACANSALARIVTKLFQNYPAPNLVPVQALETLINTSFQSEVTPAQLQLSNEFGRYVADIIYEWSKTDGTLNPDETLAACPPYIPLGGVWNWVPTPPGFLPAAGACQGSLRTFLPNIVNSTFPELPPPYSTNPSSRFYKMANEIVQLRGNLSTADSLVVEAWRDRIGMNYNTPTHLVKLTSEIINHENRNLEDASVIYAKECIAMFDAIAAVFKAKFDPSIALIRPITYIRNVMGLTNWNSVYPTPQHPAYPAVSPGAAGAAVAVLEKSFGARYSFIDSTQQPLYGSWSYHSFNELVEDVGKSRTHSGLNFRSSVKAGIKQGRTIGFKVNQLPFKKSFRGDHHH